MKLFPETSEEWLWAVKGFAIGLVAGVILVVLVIF